MATIVTRTGKGSALTHAELDANFTNINSDIATKPSTVFTGVFTTPSPSALAVTDDVLFSVEPSLRLDFVNSHRLDPRITFSRASTATRVNPLGLVEVTASGAPRFDFDPVTKASRGLLVEEQRVNLLTYSENFDNAYWTKSNSSITNNAIIAPSGNLNGFKLVENTALSSHHVQSPQSFVLDTYYSASIYVKAGERTQIRFTGANTATYEANAFFDLSTGTVSSVSAGTAKIVPVGNGWYRCTISGVAKATAFTNLQVYLVSTGTTITYTGNGTSGIYIWGIQIETGTFATSYIPSTVTHTGRASVATYTDSTGIIQSAASGVARYQYNPQNLSAAPFLLLEEARTNQLFYSEQFENPSSTTLNVSVTANSITSPAGTTTADLVTDNTTAGVEHYVEKAISVYTNQTYTQSVYVKAATAASFVFTVVAVGSSNATSNVTFTQTGGAYAPAIQTAGLITSATATPVGNGWYRCSVVYTLNGTVTYHTLRIYPYLGGLYAGTGVGHYFWGGQLEAGAFTSSYIPTTTAAATRAADTSTSAQTTRAADVATVANISSWYNAVEGTILSSTSVSVPAAYTSYPYMLGSFNTGIMLYRQSDNQPVARVRDSSVNSFINGFGASWTTTAVNKNALAYESNNFASSNNSGTPAISSSGTVPSVSVLALGSSSGTSGFLNGCLQNFIYYPARLSDSTLQALTK